MRNNYVEVGCEMDEKMEAITDEVSKSLLANDRLGRVVNNETVKMETI